MVSEEKLMMRLLRDYYICKTYAKTSISTRNISALLDISSPAVKRALHLIEDRKDDCLRMLPLAFEKAIKDGVVQEADVIDEKNLSLLQEEVELTSIILQSKNKWATSSIELGSSLIKILKDINNKYCLEKRDLLLTKVQVQRLIDSGKSFQEVADKLGISKSTAHNYYKKGIDIDSELDSQGKMHATRK